MAIDRGIKDVEVDVEEQLAELELRLERLKILYEQYFMGIEKIEPHTVRKDVNRRLIELTQRTIRNTSSRYRFNALNQKYGVYVAYWNRTLRAIENGTYYRSIAKAGREAIKKGLDIPEEILRALPERLRANLLKQRAQVAGRAAPAAAPVLAPEPVPAPPPPPAPEKDTFEADFDNLFNNLSKVAPGPPRRSPTLPPGLAEPDARDLFQRYLQAKQAVGEPTDSLKFDTVMASLAKQAPKIIADHKARSVEFSVVIRDGKVILKATPRR